VGHGDVLQEGDLRGGHGRRVVPLEEDEIGLELAQDPAEGLADQPGELTRRDLPVGDVEAAIQGQPDLIGPREMVAPVDAGAADRELAARLRAEARGEGGELQGFRAAGDEDQDLDDVLAVGAQERGVTATPVKGTP